jgi:hypothetical protein
MPNVKFSEIFTNAWKTDVIQSDPGVVPPLPVPLTFPSSYFNNINLYDGSIVYKDSITLPILDNLRVPGGTNSTFFSTSQYPNTRLGNLDGLYFGDIARYAGSLSHVGSRTPAFQYRPTKKPGVSNSFIWVAADNYWIYQTYNFATSSLSTPVETNLSYTFTSNWTYRNGMTPGEFDTDTGELGGTEATFTINEIDLGTINQSLFLASMDLSKELIVQQAANQWRYDIIAWNDIGAAIQLQVTLTASTVYDPTPNGAFQLGFLFESSNTSSIHSGYTWGELQTTPRFFVSPSKPFLLFEVNPSAGTTTEVGWWDFGGSTTIQLNPGFEYDRQSLAHIPFENLTSYPYDPYVIASFDDASSQVFQIMNTNTGFITQTSTAGHQFVKTIPKLQGIAPDFAVYAVGYGNSTYDGITIYKIVDGSISGVINDMITPGTPGNRINQVEFTGDQYERAKSDNNVFMLVSTTDGEYQIEFNPGAGTITTTYVSALITGLQTFTIIRCLPSADGNGIFLMSNAASGSSNIHWINLALAGFTTGVNYKLGSYSPRIVDDLVRKADYDGDKFAIASAGSGWLVGSGPGGGADGGSHYVPGSTGTKLSSYKEDPTGTAPSRIFSTNSGQHYITWLKNPSGADEAIILGDASSTYWKVFPLLPIA